MNETPIDNTVDSISFSALAPPMVISIIFLIPAHIFRVLKGSLGWEGRRLNIKDMVGTASGTRTHTLFPIMDFKSIASPSFAMAAYIINNLELMDFHH